MAFESLSRRRWAGWAVLRVFVAALSVVLVASLLLTAPSADAQALGVEVTGPDEIHHGGLIQTNITGITETTLLEVSLCATPGTNECRLVMTLAGKRKGTASPGVKAYRFLRNGRTFVDCATPDSQCQVQVDDGNATARTPVRFSNLRPLPELTVDSQAIVPGQTVEVSVNKFLGSDQPRNGSAVLQCPANPRRVPESQCVSHGLVKHNRPLTIAPYRLMAKGKRVVDCAAANSPCFFVVRDTYEGVRLRFAPSADVKASKVSVSQTTNLTNHQKVDVKIATPLPGDVSIFQCAKRNSSRPVCNKLGSAWSPGDPAGDLAVAISRTRPRPRRILFGDQTDIDCGDDGVDCFLRVRVNRHVVEKRIPITFDLDEQIVRPELIVPEGPYVDGQQIRVQLVGMAKGMNARFSCQVGAKHDRRFCADQTRAGADGASGLIVAIVTLHKVDACTGPASSCFLTVSTSPGTKKFLAPVQFE